MLVIYNRHRLLTLISSISILRFINRLLRFLKPRISYITTICRIAKVPIRSTIRRNPLKNNIMPETRIPLSNPKAQQ